MPIAAHVSTAGGLSTSIGRAQALGAESIQLFLSTPHRWQHPKHSDEEDEALTRLRAEAAINPNFTHAAYLLNLASDDVLMRQRSVDNLVASCAWADRLGLAGVVVHVGSGRTQSVEDAVHQVGISLRQVLEAPIQCAVLLEN